MQIYVLIVKNREGSETVLAAQVGAYGLLQDAAQGMSYEVLVWVDILGNEENLVAGTSNMRNFHIVSYTALE